MALYDEGKYPFIDLINKFSKQPHVKAYLIYIRDKHFHRSQYKDPKECCVEQWLYNCGAYEIKSELSGFIAGINFGNKEACLDHDQVIAHVTLFEELCKIHKEMQTENNWPVDDEWEYVK